MKESDVIILIFQFQTDVTSQLDVSVPKTKYANLKTVHMKENTTITYIFIKFVKNFHCKFQKLRLSTGKIVTSQINLRKLFINLKLVETTTELLYKILLQNVNMRSPFGRNIFQKKIVLFLLFFFQKILLMCNLVKTWPPQYYNALKFVHYCIIKMQQHGDKYSVNLL